MSGTRIRVSSSSPCPICGSTDYDMIMDYGSEGAVVWCHHLEYNGIVAGRDGKTYTCIKEHKESEIGIFNLFKEKSFVDAERAAWVEEQKKNNPSWSSKSSYPKRGDKVHTQIQGSSTQVSQSPVCKEVERLSEEELDKRYRYFLSLLVLEKKHENALRKEWASGVYPDIADLLLNYYPIRSLPPVDSARRTLKEKFQNPYRKQIVAKMIAKFGSVKGIPGFYMREGDYWDSKPENERWTFAGAEGILFPIIDINKRIVALRIKLDYPDIKIKETDSTLYHGKSGIFLHGYKDGGHVWYFKASGEEKGTEATDVPLKNNIPALGKSSGKYRPLSSWKDRTVGNKTVNAYKLGVSSGCPYSIYFPIKKAQSSYKFVFLTEGEKKGMITAQVKANPCVAFSGVGNYQVFFEPDKSGNKSCFDRLKEAGVVYYIICYDADKDDNRMVAAAEASLARDIYNHGGIPLIGEWSGKFDKGIDDILLMGIDINVRQFEFKKKL